MPLPRLTSFGGLERGEPVSKTGARHICRDEWLATLRDREEDIQDRIDQKMKSLKGLTTMIENLTTERNTIVGRINVIEDWLKRHQNDDDPEVQEQVRNWRKPCQVMPPSCSRLPSLTSS